MVRLVHLLQSHLQLISTPVTALDPPLSGSLPCFLGYPPAPCPCLSAETMSMLHWTVHSVSAAVCSCTSMCHWESVGESESHNFRHKGIQKRVDFGAMTMHVRTNSMIAPEPCSCCASTRRMEGRHQ